MATRTRNNTNKFSDHNNSGVRGCTICRVHCKEQYVHPSTTIDESRRGRDSKTRSAAIQKTGKAHHLLSFLTEPLVHI